MISLSVHRHNVVFTLMMKRYNINILPLLTDAILLYIWCYFVNCESYTLKTYVWKSVYILIIIVYQSKMHHNKGTSTAVFKMNSVSILHDKPSCLLNVNMEVSVDYGGAVFLFSCI